ncbi:MAG: TonB-dependent receptor [Ignavibacteriales bacterium]|nr:TonB-dependent receptor [Ignavibacteriales bacterium]
MQRKWGYKLRRGAVLVMLLSWLLPGVGYGEDYYPADTSKMYQMGDVTVTGMRLTVENGRLPIQVDVITHEEILDRNGTTLADIARTLPGVLRKAYGAGEGLSFLSMRGMSPEYTLILIDGCRVTGYQNGYFDLSLIGIGAIERIELLRGGTSALYGADAVAGTVNIVTRKPERGFHVNAQIGGGSEKTVVSGVTIEGGGADLRSSMNVHYERSAGNYPFIFSDGMHAFTLERDGAEYHCFDVSNRTDIVTSSTSEGQVFIQFHDADRGSPGMVTSQSQSEGARLHDRNLLIQAGMKSRSDVAWSLRSTFRRNDQTYRDPSMIVNGTPLDEYYLDRSLNLECSAQMFVSPALRLDGGIDVTRAWITSNELESRSRTQCSLYVSAEFVVPLCNNYFYEAVLLPAYRWDSYIGEKNAVSPKLGINLGILRRPEFHLRASLGSSFRMPTFNDMFWKGGGNPLLKPEHSTSWDAGAVTSISAYGTWKADLMFYHTVTADRILWLPGAQGLFTPRNISRATSAGIEWQLRWSAESDLLELGYDHQFVRTTEENAATGESSSLPYMPEEAASLSARIHWERMRLGLFYNFSGFRYTTSPNDPRSFLPAYDQMDLHFSYQVLLENPGLSLKAEVNNVFDSSYQLVASYPLPLRTYRIILECNY